LLEIFKQSMQSDLQLIEQGLAEGSTAKIGGAAHSIKGAAASLGIMGIHDIAKRVEEDCRAGGLDVARDNFGVLQALLTELLAL